MNDTYQSPQPNSTNPYYGQLKIALAVLNASQQPGMGGGGLGHIYHVFLPKGVDTCMEPGFGPPNGHCYSPDNGNTFFFCAYHGAFTATVNNQRQTFLYTDRAVPRRQRLPQQRPQPAAAQRVAQHRPRRPGLLDALTRALRDDQRPAAQRLVQRLSDGNEIGDLCASFDNFVTVNGHPYVLQSEYSDLHHICISGNLSNTAQTPQADPVHSTPTDRNHATSLGGRPPGLVSFADVRGASAARARAL